MAFPDDWKRLGIYTVYGTSVEGTNNLSNFPVLLKDGNFPSNVWGNCDNGGGDLRFSLDSAGATQLPCEVLSFDTSGSTGLVWVRSNTLKGSDDTDIHIWGDNTGATQPAVSDTYGRNAVWDQVFESAWHFEADGVDSAGNWDLTAYGTPTFNTGQVGNCVEFNGGTTQYLSNTTNGAGDCVGSSPLYVEAWLNMDRLNVYQNIIGKYKQSSPAAFVYQIDVTNAGKLAINTRNDAWIVENTALTQDAWEHVAVSFDGSAVAKFYQAGAADGTPTENAIVNTAGGSIGLDVGVSRGGVLEQFIDGQVDELRLAFTDLGGDWAITSYRNSYSPSTFGTGTDVSLGTTHNASISSAIGLADTQVKTGLTYQVVLDDDIGLTEKSQVAVLIARTISDAVGVTDQPIVRQVSFSRALADSLGLTDSGVSRGILVNRSISSFVGLSEELTYAFAQQHDVQIKFYIVDEVKPKIEELEDDEPKIESV